MTTRWAALFLLLVMGCGKAKPLPPVAVPVPMKMESTAFAPSPTVANGEPLYQGRTAPQWAEALTRGDAKSCETAGQALKDLGKDGYPHLLKGMRSRSWEVRLVCLRAAPKDQVIQNAGQTMPVLTALVEDANPQIAQYAVIRLGWLESKAEGTLPLLKNQLERHADNPAMREDILQTIISVRGSVPQLAELLRDSNPLIRRQAAVRLLGLARNNNRIDAAARALADSSENDDDPSVRAVARAALAANRK